MINRWYLIFLSTDGLFNVHSFRYNKLKFNKLKLYKLDQMFSYFVLKDNFQIHVRAKVLQTSKTFSFLSYIYTKQFDQGKI